VEDDDMALVAYFKGVPGLCFASATSWRWAKDQADIDAMVFLGLARYGGNGQPVELDPAWYKAPEVAA
jgi:hypothetical protein